MDMSDGVIGVVRDRVYVLERHQRPFKCHHPIRRDGDHHKLQHRVFADAIPRAAQILFRLVSKRGGEALANTDWAVLSPAGDTITETKGAFPRVILAEGEYKVIARNDNKVYQQDLTVIPGVDGEIEVLAR